MMGSVIMGANPGLGGEWRLPRARPRQSLAAGRRRGALGQRGEQRLSMAALGLKAAAAIAKQMDAAA